MERTKAMDIQQLTTFLGWCTVINFALLLLATVALTVFRQMILRVHSALLGVADKDLTVLYVTYLAHFKVLVIVFNLVPWIALKII
jgi:hypothetical protein